MTITAIAHADYECSSYLGKSSKLSVDENHVTHLGDTVVVLKSEDNKKYLFGTMFNEGGGFLKKKVIEFYGTNDTLTIVSQPKQCGRGSCDFDASPFISATLKLGESTTKFTCNEKKN